MRKKNFWIFLVPILMMGFQRCTDQPDYLNTDLSVDQRVEDLVSRMSVEEKISQMSHLAPGIDALGIEAYEPNFINPLWMEDHPDYGDLNELEEEMKNRPWENLEYWEGGCLDGGWWNEALHGVARAGLATAFPQSIGLGSTWNPGLIEKAMDVASTEARVHHQVYNKKLTYWSPTINILRDPRWGRNEESYSEDPYLLSRMAVAFVSGFQGHDEKYLKAIATVKHFVANNSEYNRHTGSADVSERWLREYYFPAFKAAITEAGAYSVMSAYNAVNGVPVSTDPWLLDDILRAEWGFKGYVVSDCGAVSDVVHGHHYETDPEKAVALTARAGTDLECETCETEQFMYDKYLQGALEKGYITEEEIDKNVKRLFRARMLLGEFDPPEMVPYTNITREDLDTPENQELALQVARESMVLLKNKDGFLPMDKKEIRSIAVIGPNADRAVLGGYSGSPSVRIDPLKGIMDLAGDDVEVIFARGCEVTDRVEVDWDEEKDEPVWEILDESATINEAAGIAGTADVAILCLGTNLDVANEAADRTDLELPGNQLKLAKKVFEANPSTVVVLINGMPLDVKWLDQNFPAILEAWYPGQAGGTAIAEVLFGEYNPGGKLPVTFHLGVDDLPPLGDYDITKGRTYWFYQGDVLYPFGYGLSYTEFTYGKLEIAEASIRGNDANIKLRMDVTNSGSQKGDEVVQVYIKDLESEKIQPYKKLRDFQRISLSPGETRTLVFELDQDDFRYWDPDQKEWIIEPGEFEIQVGSSSVDIRSRGIIKAGQDR
jgi:beta-glucosidase